MKTLNFLLFVLLCTSPLHAQSLKDLFLKMPQEICPALSEYNRLELVDNQRNNKPMQTRNTFRYVSTMHTLTDQFAQLEVSKSSEKTMKLLPLNDGSSIIMVISTVLCDSISDSSISFYSTEWKALHNEDFINQPTSAEFRQITIDPATNILTIITQNPLALHTDEGSTIGKIEPITTTLHWEKEVNKFIQ